MNQGVAGKLTVCLLDYNRPKESERCLRSIHQHFTIPRDQWRVLYLSNGGWGDHARQWFYEGLIDTHVMNQRNWGCGVAMKQMAQAALTEWVMLVQTDQYAIRPYTEEEMGFHLSFLATAPNVLYFDLAGDQGHGKASERALLINRRRYLDLPGFDDVIGGPGPFAQSKWTEAHMQEHCGGFVSTSMLFADNGKWSERDYGAAYGNARTRHSTDEKKLFILSPFARRADGFPNLNLTNAEWDEVLTGRWPLEGKVPEADRRHSFLCWPDDGVSKQPEVVPVYGEAK